MINNLNKEQCEEFLKKYKDFKRNNISSIRNPITNRYLSSKDRIELIKNLCIENHNLQSL